jgi:hypothetical protein
LTLVRTPATSTAKSHSSEYAGLARVCSSAAQAHGVARACRRTLLLSVSGADFRGVALVCVCDTVTMAADLPEITIKDEENEFDSKEFKGEYEKIYRDVVKYTTPIITTLNGLPVYYRYHIKNGLALDKGLKIERYQDFTKRRNQSQKRKENKRKEIKKEEENVEDELANQFNTTMNISTKRRRIHDV